MNSMILRGCGVRGGWLPIGAPNTHTVYDVWSNSSHAHAWEGGACTLD